MESSSELVLRLNDPRGLAAAFAALTGPGKPAGVRGCEVRGNTIVIRVDTASTPLALVRHLVELEARPFERPTGDRVVRDLDDAALARAVASAIAEPELDASRILEAAIAEPGS